MNYVFYCCIFPFLFNNIKVLNYYITIEEKKRGGGQRRRKPIATSKSTKTKKKMQTKSIYPQTPLIWESKGKEELKVRRVGFTLKKPHSWS